MGVAVRYSFETGFDSYIQKREEQRLADLVSALENEYNESGGWQGQSHKRWARLLRFSDKTSNHLRSVLHLTLLDANGSYIAGYKNYANSIKTPIVKLDGTTIGWVLSSSRLPKAVNDEIDRQFQERQLTATWIIVALSLVLAILVSLLLARILVVPVKRISQATKRLASGDYDVEVNINTADELGQLAKSFNTLANSLQKNKKLRQDLMAEISHELRTPLAILRGEIEALEDGLRSFDKAALASLLAEVKHLNTLIDDLYELTLADAGALNYSFESINISALFKQQLGLNTKRFTRKGLSLHAEIADGIHMLADSQRMTQLVNNLLENSWRYTTAPGQVWFSLKLTDNNILIEVADSAPMVPAHLLEQIFERFYRVEKSRNRVSGGAGLGLSIVKQIVAAHNGTITASDSQLGGLLIKITLPRQNKV